MSSWKQTPLTWLITGASSGFGLALTRLALSNGHKVIATSRNPARNANLVAEVERQGGQWLALDVDDAHAGSSVIQELEASGTNIDVLVNNAGWSLHGPVECITEDEARSQMETQYFGPYRLIRAVVPHMRSRRRGLILNIGSGAGINGRDSMGPYAASKAAMDGKFSLNSSLRPPMGTKPLAGLLKVMSRELAPFNVRTLNVLLGAFNTNFTVGLAVTKTPFPEDYKGSMAEKVIGSLDGGNFKPDGDHQKAARVLYEMVVGEGFGEVKEEETVMVLGRDMWTSMEEVFSRTKHMMDTFGDVCNNVYIEK